MKKLSFYFLVSILFTSCATGYQEIGSLGMLSDRHIDPNAHYKMLAANAGSTKKELKSTSATTIEGAINQVLDQVPGGKYLTNVKIYAVDGDLLAVSGDVWGQSDVKLSSATTNKVQDKTAMNPRKKDKNRQEVAMDANSINN